MKDDEREQAKERESERWDDKPLPEDDAIKDAHPTHTGEHEIYAEAMRFVSARHSKRGLVELVNWLLMRLNLFSKAEARLARKFEFARSKLEEIANMPNVRGARYENAPLIAQGALKSLKDGKLQGS